MRELWCITLTMPTSWALEGSLCISPSRGFQPRQVAAKAHLSINLHKSAPSLFSVVYIFCSSPVNAKLVCCLWNFFSFFNLMMYYFGVSQHTNSKPLDMHELFPLCFNGMFIRGMPCVQNPYKDPNDGEHDAVSLRACTLLLWWMPPWFCRKVRCSAPSFCFMSDIPQLPFCRTDFRKRLFGPWFSDFSENPLPALSLNITPH